MKLSSGEKDSLIDLKSDGTSKREFLEKSLTDFWLNVRSEFPTLADIAIKYLMIFAMTYFCKVEFSVLLLVDLKSKKRNWLKVEDDMRLKISVIQPDISQLVSSQKINHFSH
jgi:hypothetical protein